VHATTSRFNPLRSTDASVGSVDESPYEAAIPTAFEGFRYRLKSEAPVVTAASLPLSTKASPARDRKLDNAALVELLEALSARPTTLFASGLPVVAAVAELELTCTADTLDTIFDP
jgi:hypothetical protein